MRVMTVSDVVSELMNSVCLRTESYGYTIELVVMVASVQS